MKKTIISIVTLLVAIASYAQVDRTIMPEPDAPEKLNVGVLIPITFNNGLKVFLAQVKDYPKFTVSINIQQYPLQKEDREEERKIVNSSYYAKLSEQYPEGQIDSISKHMGAYLTVSTLGGTIKGMKRDSEKLLEMFSDVLFNPLISDETIKKEAEKYAEAQEKKKNKPVKKRSNALTRELLVDSLLNGGTRKKETKEQILDFESMTIDKAHKYLDERIVANNTVIVVVGNFTKKECKSLIAKHFENWKPGKIIAPEPMETSGKSKIEKRKVVVIDNPNAVQSRIVFNWNLEDAFTHFEDEIALEVMNEILGESQLSYLYKNLREDKGLCYSVRSSIGASAGGGSGAVFTSVKTDQTAYAIENMLLEMLRIKNFDVSDKDLKVAKSSLIGEYTRSLSGISPVMYISFAMTKDDYNLPDDYLQTKVSKYYSVTTEDVRKMAQKYVKPFKCLLTVTGKVEDLKGTLEKFGEVLYLDKDGKEYVFEE